MIHWGPGSIGQLAPQLRELGVMRPALVTTRSIAGSERLMQSVMESIGELRLASVSAVRQHAPQADIDSALEATKAPASDGIVSIGGGSPIDAAKIVSVRSADLDGKRLPHVAIPTTLSAAELAAGAGYTNVSGDKAGVRDDRGLPDCVIYDAELALHTPMELWLSTGIRALDHAVEIFLSDGEHQYADALSLEAFRRLMLGLPKAKAHPEDVDVRADNQLAAWLSNSQPAVAAAGLSHMLGKQIGARHGIPHGVTSCLLLPHVLRFRASGQADRLAELAQRTGCGNRPEDVTEAVAGLIRALGLPQHVGAYGLGEAELSAAAEALVAQNSAMGFSAPELTQIYLAAV